MYLQNADDEKWRARYGFTYISLRPRLDTFPLISETYATGYAPIVPGWEVISKQTLGFVFGGYDYSFLDPTIFFIYPGADLIAGFTSIKYHTYYEGIEDKEESTGGVIAGLRLRAGAEYMVTETIGIIAEASHSVYYMSQDVTWHAHTDYGIGIQLIFE